MYTHRGEHKYIVRGGGYANTEGTLGIPYGTIRSSDNQAKREQPNNNPINAQNVIFLPEKRERVLIEANVVDESIPNDQE